mmetsp:Transcript_5756/g.6609  ORF Transcript_5756/g.6609 Transcript_5756/m.6609 type:complete len:233 (+) Transcript_5756:311-1009(+)|eukprot:CAMPEP_0197862740 /NCGR_PEP_ID=MMETSP1438-20131217/39729_1 /TAXON_ID=1461541 /ORGANISM="Pterosperma sp., Strain CCMP1384" /LENGTH=232 /DNA_ID=CAMNT_0043480401 /DNA_START=288 /DNA_END=986 /DNA_ORIENTATION=+
MSDRPGSAVRRPGSARNRPGSARNRPGSARRGLPPEVAAASGLPPDPDADGDEAYWLFSTAYRLTTTDIALAGFTTVVLLDAVRWKPVEGDELTPEACAASEIAYTFGFPDDKAPPSMTGKHRMQWIECLKGAFVGRGGDCLVIFQNVCTGEGTELGEGPDAELAMTLVARTVDCINSAYADQDAAGVEGLAGVSVVLEGFARSGMFKLEGSWDTGSPIEFDVQAFTDALPA